MSAFLASFFYRLYSHPLLSSLLGAHAIYFFLFLKKRCLSVAFQRTAVILVPSLFTPSILLLSFVCYWQQMIWYGAIYIYVHLVMYLTTPGDGRSADNYEGYIHVPPPARLQYPLL